MFFSIPYLVLPAEPCTISRHASRTLGLPASVALAGVIAGSMDSRNGSATATPIPCNIVRRDMCCLVMNIFRLLSGGFGAAHFERRALHDSQDVTGKTVVVFGGIAVDRPHQRHVVILEATAEGICHQLFSQVLNKGVRMLLQDGVS